MSKATASDSTDTEAPRRGSMVTSPSAASARNASRTGMRLAWKRAASSSCLSGVPAGKAPVKISKRS
ncbi:hypothetical protein G6F58_013743 [Rhizopus delemar]|nr:hypothetical protein G6F58_013743 [Rhizopus delemar]